MGTVRARGAGAGPTVLNTRRAWGGRESDAGCGSGPSQKEALWRAPWAGQSLLFSRPAQVGDTPPTHWLCLGAYISCTQSVTRHQSCGQWLHISEQRLVPAVWEVEHWNQMDPKTSMACRPHRHTHTDSLSIYVSLFLSIFFLSLSVKSHVWSMCATCCWRVIWNRLLAVPQGRAAWHVFLWLHRHSQLFCSSLSV